MDQVFLAFDVNFNICYVTAFYDALQTKWDNRRAWEDNIKIYFKK
jgi:hypothetical protein